MTRLEKIDKELENLFFIHEGFREVGARDEMRRVTRRIWDLNTEAACREAGYTESDVRAAGCNSWSKFDDHLEEIWWAQNDAPNYEDLFAYGEDLAAECREEGWIEIDGTLVPVEKLPF
jgi:hypothetical protein